MRLLVLACLLLHPVVLPSAGPSSKLQAVRRLGRPGDWLVVRGVHATDDFVAAVRQAPFSHAAILDPEKDQAIEAEGVGIHTTPLPDFLKKVRRVWLVRPVWGGEDRHLEALRRARERVGGKYDFTGLVGLDHPERYYCSELAVAVYRPYFRSQDRMPPVIPPDHLHYWGTVLWDSGPEPPEIPVTSPKAAPGASR